MDNNKTENNGKSNKSRAFCGFQYGAIAVCILVMLFQIVLMISSIFNKTSTITWFGKKVYICAYDDQEMGWEYGDLLIAEDIAKDENYNDYVGIVYKPNINSKEVTILKRRNYGILKNNQGSIQGKVVRKHEKMGLFFLFIRDLTTISFIALVLIGIYAIYAIIRKKYDDENARYLRRIKDVFIFATIALIYIATLYIRQVKPHNVIYDSVDIPNMNEKPEDEEKPGNTLKPGNNGTQKPNENQGENGETQKPEENGSGNGETQKPGSTGSENGETQKPESTGSENGETQKPGSTGSENGETQKPGSTGSENSETQKPGSTEGGNGNNQKPGDNQGENNETQKPTEKPEENIPENPPVQGDFNIIVTDQKGSWDQSKSLDVFKNEYFNDTNKIAPGVSGRYEFQIQNKSKYDINYDVNINEENLHNINLLYRIQKNGEFIDSGYKRITEFGKMIGEIKSKNTDTYTIYWKWFDAENDTQIGIDAENVRYKLNFSVTATQK